MRHPGYSVSPGETSCLIPLQLLQLLQNPPVCPTVAVVIAHTKAHKHTNTHTHTLIQCFEMGLHLENNKARGHTPGPRQGWIAAIGELQVFDVLKPHVWDCPAHNRVCLGSFNLASSCTCHLHPDARKHSPLFSSLDPISSLCVYVRVRVRACACARACARLHNRVPVLELAAEANRQGNVSRHAWPR